MGSARPRQRPGADALAPFRLWLDRWSLDPDGAPIATPAARLIPVRPRGCRDQPPLMLRLSDGDDARRAGELMRWWDGGGAARVVALDHPALLMERAQGGRELAAMARDGQDEAACRILCGVAGVLHAPRPGPPPALIPLDRWFRDLWPFAATQGGVWADAAAVARRLLAAPQQTVALHGDLHHGNVLDFGPRGWLAIDPHALHGERGFDVANIFANPDLDDPARPLALRPGIFARRVDTIAKAARLDRRRLLGWVLARSALSAAWFAQDGDPLIGIERTIAGMAAAALRA